MRVCVCCSLSLRAQSSGRRATNPPPPPSHLLPCVVREPPQHGRVVVRARAVVSAQQTGVVGGGQRHATKRQQRVQRRAHVAREGRRLLRHGQRCKRHQSRSTRHDDPATRRPGGVGCAPLRLRPPACVPVHVLHTAQHAPVRRPTPYARPVLSKPRPHPRVWSRARPGAWRGDWHLLRPTEHCARRVAPRAMRSPFSGEGGCGERGASRLLLHTVQMRLLVLSAACAAAAAAGPYTVTATRLSNLPLLSNYAGACGWAVGVGQGG
jgi:hypothetical protein